MTTTHWFIVGGALLLGGLLAAGWLGVQFARAPYLPDQRSSFDEHAATACAALDSDAPLNTLSDHWLAYVDSLPTTHEREYTL